MQQNASSLKINNGDKAYEENFKHGDLTQRAQISIFLKILQTVRFFMSNKQKKLKMQQKI